jgi:hypothetical protein
MNTPSSRTTCLPSKASFSCRVISDACLARISLRNAAVEVTLTGMNALAGFYCLLILQYSVTLRPTIMLEDVGLHNEGTKLPLEILSAVNSA